MIEIGFIEWLCRGDGFHDSEAEVPWVTEEGAETTFMSPVIVNGSNFHLVWPNKRDIQIFNGDSTLVFDGYFRNTPKIINIRNVYLWEHCKCLLDQSSAWILSGYVSIAPNQQNGAHQSSALSCSRIDQLQCEANADTEIVSTTVEHLHSNKPVLTKAGVSAKNVKTRLNLKRCGVVYDISETQFFSPTSEVCDSTMRLFW